ncbi:MAG: acetyl-CoA carboxylase biotin carboxylase subunit [Candidatus Puniceispirillaceae bacterium]
MFKKILIANRGEIACRIMATAQKMKIKTVAVYSDADANAPHVQMADEAVHIGAAPSKESYLLGDVIIQAALDSGAEAIHPGYGFLSENAGFVEAVKKAGLSFIGPDVRAISVMGDKIESKALAQSAGVSCVPGTDGAVSDVTAAVKAAAAIGYPVMVKASAGGGGKGMRVVQSEVELPEAMRAAMTEAANAFGDDRVFIEKFVVSPRHIEIQVLGDTHGHVVYLGERECSVQRRHQKVIEEAPSSFISEATRKAMGEQAVELAKAVDYVSAGTVEFIVGADQDFYFLEMNTRLQVEHPVTEQVYGLDLVEQMIRIAAGEALSLKQADITPKGWSIEARLYAEDSARGFLPSTGQLLRYSEPQGKGIRADSGVCEGGMISMFYDPMIAKLIASAPTRAEAIDSLRLALDHYQIAGVATNRQFLSAILDDADFRAGNITTGFIAEKYGDAFAPFVPAAEAAEKLMALAAAFHARAQTRLQEEGHADKEFVLLCRGGDEAEMPVMASWCAGTEGDQVTINKNSYHLTGTLDQPLHRSGILFDGTINEQPTAIQIVPENHTYHISSGADSLTVEIYPARAAELLAYMPPPQSGAGQDKVCAPMPGLLTRLMVEVGDVIEAGQNVAVIEAMKMENTLAAQIRGTVLEISANTGDNLNVDDVILTLKPEGEEA